MARRLRRALVAALVAGLAAAPSGAQPAPTAPRDRAPDGPAPAAVLAPVGPAAALVVAPAEYAARRAALVAQLPDSVSVVVAFGAPEPREDYHTFAQAPDFQWLTGFAEPEAALVLVQRRGAVERGTLFVRPSDPAQEVWTGRRLGLDGAAAATGLATRPAGALREVLDSLAAAGLPMAFVGDLGAGGANGGETLSRDAQRVAALRAAHPALAASRATGLVQRLRERKSAAELARLRRAVDVTVRAHHEAMGLVRPGLAEFEVQALIEYTFRRHGAERPGFASIVGSGPNATVLHYTANDRVMQAGELVVMDVGASYAGYTADVTRTLPVSGTFTPAQRALYQAVRDAQAAAERAAVPGAAWSTVQDSARVTLARGLARLGLIEGPEATYDCGRAPLPDGSWRQCAQVGLYYLHGLGHGIGLEVHDPDQGVPMGVLAEGSAFTLEPGAYVRRDALAHLASTPRNARLRAAVAPAVARLADMGVRIEDDYLITATGTEWISRAPREVGELEAAMREARRAGAARPDGWRGPAPRDSALVAGYVPR